MDAILWLVILVACIVVEIFTLGLTTIWFAGGALIAFVAALLSAPLWLEVILFVIASAALLFFTRPLAMKLINKETVKTNYESMTGRVGVVTEQVDNLNATGCVRVSGQDWTARSAAAEEIIPTDTEVVVLGIEGVKLMVSPVNKEERQ